MVAIRQRRGAGSAEVGPVAADVPAPVPTSPAPAAEALEATSEALPEPMPPQPAESALQARLREMQAAEEAQQQYQRDMQERLQAAVKPEPTPKQQEAPGFSERDLAFMGARPGIERNAQFLQTAQALSQTIGYGSDKFYSTLEHIFPVSDFRRVEPETPAIVEPIIEQQPARPRGPVTQAPPSRQSVSAGTGRPMGSKVALTALEKEIALSTRQPGMTDQQALIEYSRNKLRLQSEKQAGFYRDDQS